MRPPPPPRPPPRADRAQTVVGTLPQHIVKDPRIFDDPEAFDPDRWLGDDAQALDKWIVAFGYGARQCVGIQ